MAQPTLLPWQNDTIGHTPIWGPIRDDGQPSLQEIEKRSYDYTDSIRTAGVVPNIYSGSAYPLRPDAVVVLWFGPVEPPTTGGGAATANDLWIPT